MTADFGPEIDRQITGNIIGATRFLLAGNRRYRALIALLVQLVVLASAFVMVSTVWSLSCSSFFYSRCPRAQSFVKVGSRALVPYGVGATFVGQFTLKIIIKQPFNLNAQCCKDYFPSVCVESYARSDTINLIGSVNY